jgi:hypothetical protein
MTMSLRTYSVAAALALAPLVTGDARASSTTVGFEAVCDYGGGCKPNTSDLPNAIPNCAGFSSWMTNSFFHSVFTHGPEYTDSSVFDTDFIDPELTLGGADYGNFDPSGQAISYFCGHGTSDDGFGNVSSCGSGVLCGSSANCTAARNPYGTGTTGVCRHAPGDNSGKVQYGYCSYPTNRYIIINEPSPRYSNAIDYSTGRFIAFGESPTSGTWRGAGTDGGTNVVVLDLSNGLQPGFPIQNLMPAFAGVHEIMTIMPTYGDTAMVADRGSAFAESYIFNTYGDYEPSTAWLEAINQLSGEGGVCTDPCGATKVTSGGWGGINGCGCNVVMAMGANSSEPNQHIRETWNDIQNDALDGRGNSYYAWYYLCNYDTTTYPIILP